MAFDDRFIAQQAERRIADFISLPLTWISGVEVTQSIQYYRASAHLTDPADRGANNSVRLVANKPAWVRVYVRSLFTNTVTASLELRRRAFGFIYHPVGTLSPQGAGTITSDLFEPYDGERMDPTRTINFVIPAADFTGNLRLIVRLTDASSGKEVDTETIHVNAALRQTLRLRAIFVSYNGPNTASPPAGTTATNITLAAPTLANAQATAARAMLMMPVRSTGSFTSAGTLPWNMPLDDPRSEDGGCSTNWDALMIQLGNRRTNDGNRADVVYYGLLPAGIPLNVPGCGVGGLGAGVVGDQQTFVHEIGHGYDFAHTPCGNVGTADPNYPTYEPYGAASIGEYGFNISTGTVLSPATNRDYMSYCFPQWMSLYQHSRLIHHPRLGPEFVGDEPLWTDKLEYREYNVARDLPMPPDPWKQVDMRRNPIIAISGLVHAADDVEVVTVARVEAAGSPAGDRTRLTAQLLNADGRVIARAPIVRLRSHGDCGCGDGDDPGERGSYAFQAYIPNVERGEAIRIADGEKVVWERRAPERPPRVGRLHAEATDDGLLRFAYEADVASDDGEAWLQWSDDKGETWNGLTTGIRDREGTVDLTGVPSGSIQVRLLVSDGFDTAVSPPARVRVPDRRPEIVILAPSEGDTLIAGRPMRLWAGVTSPDGSVVEDVDGRWFIDEENVGRGLEAWTTAPAEGEHRATFTIDRRSTVSVAFRTFDAEAAVGRQGPG